MPVVTLTTRNVLTLASAPGQRVDFIDSSLPGFMLRVSANNVRSYAVWYRVHGRARRFTSGSVNTISLADAREQARRILAEARTGRDAVAERQRERAAAHKAALLAMTFTALAERYLAHEGPSLAPCTVSAYRNILRADILPDFGDLPPHRGAGTRAHAARRRSAASRGPGRGIAAHRFPSSGLVRPGARREFSPRPVAAAVLPGLGAQAGGASRRGNLAGCRSAYFRVQVTAWATT